MQRCFFSFISTTAPFTQIRQGQFSDDQMTMFMFTTYHILVADHPLRIYNVSLCKHPLHAGVFLTVSLAAKLGGGVVVMAAMAPSHQEATPTLARGRYTGRA
jgi:hypothetical protein